MNSVFGEQILADKLSKLNSTQQCIETLSHWCIFHRSKAEQVVATWDKQFRSSDMAQKVPLLYLANDILQNSKRKGNEFVTEFWKVLPSALKDLTNKGDDRGKKVVSRLVGIWEERKVFGSHAQSLKDTMLGEELPPPLEFRKKRSRSVRIVKKDSRSIKTKLSIGGTAEKIVSAFHSVLSEHATEDEQMSKCKSAIHRVKKMEKDIDVALTKAKDPSRKKLSEGLEEEEKKLKQCIDKLKEIETNRVALVSELRDALHEQESELENLRTQMQVAQAHVQEATNTRKQLGEDRTFDPKQLTTVTEDANSKQDQTSKKSAAAIAAEVADRLAASSSSQYIMASVLSTFAAEEAKNAGLSTSSTPTTSSFSSNAENQNQNHIPVSDPNVFTPSQQQINPPHNPPYQYHSIGNPPSMQYMQSYDYGNIPPMPAGPPPPAPAPPSYMVSPMVPMMQQQPLQMSHQPQIPQPASFRPLTPIQPPGMVYYTHPYQSQ